MQNTSTLYKTLLAGEHTIETRLAIGERGRLIDEHGDTITFGGDRINISSGGADDGFGENQLFSLKTTSNIFSNGVPEVGCCIAGEIDVRMFKPIGIIPRMAQLIPYVRLANGETASEWLQKGIFFIDTRSYETFDDSTIVMTLHGYDAMMRSEQDYDGKNINWDGNVNDISVVQDIAENYLGVTIEANTEQLINHAYKISYPGGYTCREVLGYIAAMYAGNFVIDELGNLKLIQLFGIPKETNLLIDEHGYQLMIGGVHILV